MTPAKILCICITLALPLISHGQTSNGIVCTGQIGGEKSGNFRGSSCLEAQGKNPTISIYQSGPPSTKTESALVYGANVNKRSPRKSASISSMARSVDPVTGFYNLRFNATYNGGKTDDVFLRGWGHHGATFFGRNEDDYFGPNMLAVRGQVYALNGRQEGSTEFYLNSQFLSPEENKGIATGYSGTRQDGAIACVGAKCGLQLWTHDGLQWGMRLRIAPSGALEFNGPTQEIDGNNYLAVSVNGKPSLIPLETVESLNARRQDRQHAMLAAAILPLLLLAAWLILRRITLPAK